MLAGMLRDSALPSGPCTDSFVYSLGLTLAASLAAAPRAHANPVDLQFDFVGQPKDRECWHYQWRDGNNIRNKYVGPVSNAAINDRVTRFANLKASFKRRQTSVRALIAAGLACR
jgi:hypothetical protein